MKKSANYKITKISVNSSGNLEELEINNENALASLVPIVYDSLKCWKDESDNVAYTVTATPTTDDAAFYLDSGALAAEAIEDIVDESTITIDGTDYSRYEDGDVDL